MKKVSLMPMTLQYFAEENSTEKVESQEAEIVAEQEEKKEVESETKEDDKQFSAADVQRIIDERFAREKKQAEKAKIEATKLAKMNEEQKQEYERQQIEKRAEYAEKKLATYEMRSEARKMFDEKGVNVTDEDLNLVVTAEAETTKENVAQLVAFVERQRSEVTQELLKGTTPKVTGSSIKMATQKEFDVMTYSERINLQKNDPDGFRKLTGGI